MVESLLCMHKALNLTSAPPHIPITLNSWLYQCDPRCHNQVRVTSCILNSTNKNSKGEVGKRSIFLASEVAKYVLLSGAESEKNINRFREEKEYFSKDSTKKVELGDSERTITSQELSQARLTSD